MFAFADTPKISSLCAAGKYVQWKDKSRITDMTTKSICEFIIVAGDVCGLVFVVRWSTCWRKDHYVGFMQITGSVKWIGLTHGSAPWWVSGRYGNRLGWVCMVLYISMAIDHDPDHIQSSINTIQLPLIGLIHSLRKAGGRLYYVCQALCLERVA